MSGDKFETLKRLDVMGLNLLASTDAGKETDERLSYYDGYAAGIRQAQSAIRKFIETECPDFHDRVAGDAK